MKLIVDFSHHMGEILAPFAHDKEEWKLFIESYLSSSGHSKRWTPSAKRHFLDSYKGACRDEEMLSIMCDRHLNILTDNRKIKVLLNESLKTGKTILSEDWFGITMSYDNTYIDRDEDRRIIYARGFKAPIDHDTMQAIMVNMKLNNMTLNHDGHVTWNL